MSTWRGAGMFVAALATPMAACNSAALPPPAALDASTSDLAADLSEPREPWDRDLSLRLTDLDADEGTLAHLRIYNTAVSVRTPWRTTTVKGGIIEAYWRGGFDSDTFGEFVDLYLDRDANSLCTDTPDSAYRLFINNTFPPDGIVRADIRFKTPATQGGPQPLPCSQLD